MARLRLMLCLPLLGGIVADAAPAAAFWERSQWARCSEAPTRDAWERARCWELEPGRHWSSGGQIGTGQGQGSLVVPGAGDRVPRKSGPVARRLG